MYSPNMSKTELKRDILLALQNNPDATNKSIAKDVGCSESYVSQVKQEFDDYDNVDAMADAIDREVDQLEDDIDDAMPDF
jgi:hypothetical protein